MVVIVVVVVVVGAGCLRKIRKPLGSPHSKSVFRGLSTVKTQMPAFHRSMSRKSDKRVFRQNPPTEDEGKRTKSLPSPCDNERRCCDTFAGTGSSGNEVMHATAPLNTQFARPAATGKGHEF